MNPNPFQPPVKPVPVILDTDMATDCDDAGALAVLHALERTGEARILGVVTNNLGDSSTGAVAAINSYFGREEIPLGAYQESLVGVPNTPIADNLADDTATFGHRIQSRSQVPSAVALYRRILATRRDPDVVIISIGHLNNLHDLLQSNPDDCSNLNGVELVHRSVAHCVVMGGAYPEGQEHNFQARGSSRYTSPVLDAWPTPMLFSGYELGVRVSTGKGLARFGEENPVARAYRIHPDNPIENGRPSWDQTAVLAAVRGPRCHWNLSAPGRNRAGADGANQWNKDPAGFHAYLLERDPPEEVAAEIDRLMALDPSARNRG